MAHGIGEIVSADGTTIKMINENNNNNNHHHHTQANNHQALQQQSSGTQQQHQTGRKNVGVMGSRRIFAAAFKLKVLDSYRNDIDCRGNQRATARKYGIHRRQIQKWLQCEDNLRSSCADSHSTTTVTSSGCCAVPVGNGVAGANVSAMSMAAQTEIISKPKVTIVPTTSSSMSINNNGIVDNGNGVSMISVNANAGTPIVTPVPATPAPALNLSLARLHGDEQQHHEHQHAARSVHPPPHIPSGPPVASPRHTSRSGSSPTSIRYLHHNSHHHHAPTSSSPNTVPPLRNTLVGYADYASQQDPSPHLHQQHQQNYQRHQRRQQPNEHHQNRDNEITKNSSVSPGSNYSYVVNRTNGNYDHQDIINGTVPTSRGSPHSETYYPTQETYRNSVGFVGLTSNNDNNDANEMGLAGGASPGYRDKDNNVDNAIGNTCEPSPSSPLTQQQQQQQQQQPTSFASPSSPVLHATTIKSERSSPDSVATPGPCETSGSPESVASMPRARLHNHHQQQQQRQSSLPRRLTDSASSDTTNVNPNDVYAITNTKNNHVNRTSTTAAAIASNAVETAVLSSATTSPLAHVHVRIDLHASNARNSQKQHLDREQREEPHRNGVCEADYKERMGGRVKEEIVDRDEIGNAGNGVSMTMTTRQPKREMSEDDDALIEHSRYHRERTTADMIVSCTDYQAATALPVVTTRTGLSSVDHSDLASPVVRDSNGSYSGLSSPRAASSSGISTSSSCSDSEIDPLDYSSNSARNAITDLSRRRSFSLRFKLDVLDAFHGDAGVAGNQRATARKFGINRRQVQKWLGQESELRGEIALRGGDLRQRLGPMTETANNETSIPVDLRTCSIVNYHVGGYKNETDNEHPSPPLYCCDVGSTSQRLGYNYHVNHANIADYSDIQPRTCTLSCCVDGLAPASMMCYQDSLCQRRSSVGYPESQGSLYCYSPRDTLDNGSVSEGIDVTMSSPTMKRSACMMTCCYDMAPSPKRICLDSIEEPRSSPISQDSPPQEAPLCLVKPKSCFGDSIAHREPVTSTVPTPPSQLAVSPPVSTPASKKNAILFKPYLDNPVSKPTDDVQLDHHQSNNQRGLSPISAQNVNANNNNNCHGICNLNDERSIVSNNQHDYALELSLRVPVTWQTHPGYGEFPESIRSAFVRYPTSPHYT